MNVKVAPHVIIWGI